MFKQDLVGLCKIGCKHGLHFESEIPAEDDGIDLIVPQKAPQVHVGRPNRRPDPIDYGRFRMQDVPAALIELNP